MKQVLIVNALIWAVVILLVSYLTKESEHNTLILGILVVGFTLQNGLTYELLKKRKKPTDLKS